MLRTAQQSGVEPTYDPNQDPQLEGMVYDPDQDPELQNMLNDYNPDSDPELQKLLSSETIETNTTLPEVNSPFLQKVEMIESGGNPNAKATTSSASGSFQFTDPTWKSMVNRYGAQTGIKLEDKGSREAQMVMADLLAKENGEILSKKGFKPTDENLYLAHFLGPGGAGKVLSNPNSPAATLLPTAAKANRNMFYNKNRPITGMELQQIIARKLANA